LWTNVGNDIEFLEVLEPDRPEVLCDDSDTEEETAAVMAIGLKSGNDRQISRPAESHDLEDSYDADEQVELLSRVWVDMTNMAKPGLENVEKTSDYSVEPTKDIVMRFVTIWI